MQPLSDGSEIQLRPDDVLVHQGIGACRRHRESCLRRRAACDWLRLSLSHRCVVRRRRPVPRAIRYCVGPPVGIGVIAPARGNADDLSRHLSRATEIAFVLPLPAAGRAAGDRRLPGRRDRPHRRPDRQEATTHPPPRREVQVRPCSACDRSWCTASEHLVRVVRPIA